jgi:hypothetical protein
MTEIREICPVCGDVRGLAQTVCKSSLTCLEVLEAEIRLAEEIAAKLARMDIDMPGWRERKYANGAPMWSSTTGMMLNDRGTRSIFDDVDE